MRLILRMHYLQHPTIRRFSPSNAPGSGFALVIALGLMAFVLLLLLSITTLVRVESSVAGQSLAQLQARQAAILSSRIALGELQRMLGPDVRTTARGQALDVNSPNPYWTGVWYGDGDPATDESAIVPGWLVSGNQSSALDWEGSSPATAYPTAYREPSINLEASAVASVDLKDPVLALPPDTGLRAPWVDTSEARFAYAVLDEGVKARFNRKVEVDTATNSAYEGYVPGGPRPDLAAVDLLGWEALPAGKLERVRMPSELPLVLPDADLAVGWGADLTGVSMGVLSNQAEGGLKRNLTWALEDNSAYSDLLAEYGAGLNNNRVFGAQGGAADSDLNLGGPRWGQLREFVAFREQAQSSPLPRQSETVDRQAIAPVLTLVSLWLDATLVPVQPPDPDLRRVRFHFMPVISLWNPYSTAIEGGDLYLLWDLYAAQIGVDGWRFELSSAGEIIAPNTDGGAWDNPLTADIPRPRNNFLGSRPGAMLLRLDVPQINPGEVVFLRPNASTPLSFNVADIELGENLMTAGSPTTGLNAFYIDSVQTVPATETGTNAKLYSGQSMNNGRIFLAKSVSEILFSPLQTVNRLVYRATDNKFYGSGILQDGSALGVDVALGNGQFPRIGLFGVTRFAEDYLETLSPHFGSLGKPRLPWLTMADPAGPYHGPTFIERASSGDFGRSYSPSVQWNSGNANTNDYDILLEILQNAGGVGFAGYSSRPPLERAILWELRAGRPPASLGELTNARLFPSRLDGGGSHADSTDADRNANYEMAYQVGNSRAPSWLAQSNTSFRDDWSALSFAPGVLASIDLGFVPTDTAYHLNQALWDRFFLTGAVSETPAGLTKFPLANPTLAPRADTLEAAEFEDYEGSAAKLMQTGAFNVNSDSRVAWEALLAATYGSQIERSNGNTESHPDTAPYSRFRSPPLKAIDPATDFEDSPEVYGGYRALTLAEIQALAAEIVAEVRARGPFRSLAAFINRDPKATNPEHRLKGALEAAIQRSGINDFLFKSGSYTHTTQDYDSFYVTPRRLTEAITGGTADDAKVSMADQAPGALTQMDLLAQLGPHLTARSDTFVILARGEAINSITGEPTATASLLLTVQRSPDWLDSTSLEPEQMPLPAGLNARFGRRFDIVDFRWL